MSRTQVQLWYNQFKEDRENVNDDARTGRPSFSTTDENIEGVKKTILDNHTYIIAHYNPSVRIIDLVAHTTYYT